MIQTNEYTLSRMFLGGKFSDLKNILYLHQNKDVDERYYHCRNKLGLLSVFTYLTTRKYSEKRFSTELEKLKQDVEASRTENEGKKRQILTKSSRRTKEVIKDCNERYN